MFIRKNRQRKNELVFPFRYQMNIQSLAWNSLTIIHQQKSISLKETSVISKLQSEFQLMERKSIHFSSSITGHNKRRIELLLIWLIKWNVWSFFIINKLYNWIKFVILTIPRLIFLCVSAMKIDLKFSETSENGKPWIQPTWFLNIAKTQETAFKVTRYRLCSIKVLQKAIKRARNLIRCPVWVEHSFRA